ncbi:MAG: ATP-binding cassette domain-containing protein, partial [Clostridia bacterium]|nr:ATP-binding cassette domain-containing protein [Clostridia bacterium]
YMLQRDHLFEWRTIWKNVTLGLEINKTKTAANCQYVENLLKKYGLWEFAKHYPPQLSGGMRQRAALIRTLATNPDLLLLDEPFSALDFQTRLAVCDDVYKIIRSENKTAVLVTHDISEAISMSDRILVLSSRPSSVILVHETGLSDIDTPLKRRESAQFAPQFEMLYNLLNSQKGANYG